jgi:hypothetical protein
MPRLDTPKDSTRHLRIRSLNEPLHPATQHTLEQLVKLHGAEKLISAIHTIAARLGIED